MLLKRLEVRNFRCAREALLECDNLTALVGRNGAGKSCLMQALQLLYAVSPNISAEDFFNRDTARPIEIIATFRHLLPEEAAAFGNCVKDGELTVIKRIRWDGDKGSSRVYGMVSQHPAFATVRSSGGRTEIRNAYNALVGTEGFEELARVTSADAAEAAMLAFEAAHPDRCQLVERETQFLGPTSIGIGSLDKFTKFVFIPAVREATAEAGDGKGSSLGALLDMTVRERVAGRPELRSLQEHLQAKYAEIFGPDSQPELDDLAAAVTGILADFHPGSSLGLDWGKPTPPELALPSVRPTLTEDDFAGHVSRKGNGLQRALVLALLQLRAGARPTDQAAAAPEPEQGDAAAPQPSSARLILAIEEPELYQHPLQCRHWAAVLRRLTTPAEGQEVPRTQVVFTTHSPHFVSLSWFDQIRIVRKKRLQADRPPEATVHRATLTQVGARLAEATGQRPEEFTAATTRARANPVMTAVLNEGFFANLVVLTEGDTEIGLLTALARRMGKDWNAKGVAVLAAGGKTKLLQPRAIFASLGIPVFVLFDADAHERTPKDVENNRRINRELLTLMGAAAADFPESHVGNEYAVFHELIETELKQSIGDARYAELTAEVARELGYTSPTKAMKNADCATAFADRVYASGGAIPMIEQIVDRADSLVAL